MRKMCRLFSEPVGRQIISLLVLITLEQVNTSVVGKKKRLYLVSKTLMVRLTGRVQYKK